MLNIFTDFIEGIQTQEGNSEDSKNKNKDISKYWRKNKHGIHERELTLGNGHLCFSGIGKDVF